MTTSILFNCKTKDTETPERWIKLFNGKDLTNWIVKINGFELNNNFNNTKAENGVIKISSLQKIYAPPAHM